MRKFTKQVGGDPVNFCSAAGQRARRGRYRPLPMDAALAAAATLVAAAFGLSTLDRWMRRHGPHELAWSVSLALFAIGAGALWWAESRGWSLATFRVFYLAGAVLNVPWLALGTVYLLAGRSAGDRARWWLTLFTGLSAGVVLFAPTRAGVAGRDLPTGKDVFGVAPRVLAAVGSGVAALVIVAGALWSVARLIRGASTSSPRRLVVGNVLIAAGTLVLSASGTLAGRLGKDTAFAVTLLLGIAVLFAGFLVASTSPRRRAVSLHQRAA